MEIREEDYHMKKRRRTQRYPYLRDRKQLIDKRQKQRKYTEKKKENRPNRRRERKRFKESRSNFKFWQIKEN